MLKKTMIAFMALELLVRGGATIRIMALGETGLPGFVLFATAMICTFFLVLLVKYFTVGVKRRELEKLFALNAFLVLLNLILVKFSTPVNINVADFLAMGTLFDIAACCTFTVLSLKRTSYITRVKL